MRAARIISDMLLISVFGGIINGFSISLCLIAGATSGGTDFISIAISEKYHVDAFNYILIFNAVMLTADGFIFGWEKALYSIIFQYTSTQVINLIYTANLTGTGRIGQGDNDITRLESLW